MRQAIFLDRDDTLIRCTGHAPEGDLGDPALVELLPGAHDACARLADAGFFLAVVTNQGGVARGRYTEADVQRVHRRVNELLDGLIDDFRYCPYHPRGTVPRYTREHPWRKPAPGMLIDLADRHDLNLDASWLIGDAVRDCEAGRSAGCRCILLSDQDADPSADACASDIREAARHLLTQERIAP